MWSYKLRLDPQVYVSVAEQILNADLLLSMAARRCW